jgi:transposase InsO family protein
MDAFLYLKEQLTSEDTVLIKPDFEKPFYLQTDASAYGLGAVLTQKDEQGRDKVVSYASRTLAKPERQWHSYELEALAAIWGCEHFRTYLIGRKFTLQTDNSAVKWLMEQTKPGRLQRWVLRIQEFDFTLEHRPGKSNGNADGPSRNPVPYLKEDEDKLEALAYGLPLEPRSLLIKARCCPKYRADYCLPLMSKLKEREEIWQKLEPKERDAKKLSFSAFTYYMDQVMNKGPKDVVLLESPFFRDAFREAQLRDEGCLRIKHALDEKAVSGMKANEYNKIRKNYCYNADGIICINRRWKAAGNGPLKQLVIVPNEYRDEILRLYHNAPHGGHLGGNKMYSRVRETFFWKNVGRDCKNYSASCAMCNSRKAPRPYYQGKMVIRETVGPWEHVSYDLLSGFKTSKRGYTQCLVVMDEFTKGVEVIPIKDAETETVARAMVNEVFYRHGIPRKLHSDRGSNMNISHVMKNVCELLGISRSFTTAGHPEGNGLVERFNRFLVQGLYCLMNRQEDDWDLQLPALLFAYRTSVHPTTGETPFFLMHGRDAVLPGDLLLSKINQGKQSHQRYARQVYLDLHESYKIVRDRISEMQKKQKRYYDEYHKKKDVEFSGGDTIKPADLVVIYYQEPHVVGESTKFRSKWSVPFRVVRQMSNGVNYEVQGIRNPDMKKIVHVSRIRKYNPWTPYFENLPPDHIDISLPFPGYVPDKNEPKTVLPSTDYEIDQILDQYTEQNGKSRKIWYLIHWAGYPDDAVAWVLSEEVRAIDIVKEWKKKVRKFPQQRKRMLTQRPSKRPVKFRWDDPKENAIVNNRTGDDSSVPNTNDGTMDL